MAKRRAGKDAFTGRKTKSGPVRKSIESKGVRKRLGREVMDATSPIIMPLTKQDIERAIKARNGYDVDEPDNFRACAVAQLCSRSLGAEVLIARKHAYVALPDEEYTFRYEVDAATTEVIHMNDEHRLHEIPPNVSIVMRPPAPSCRLAAQRANAKKNNQYRETRGSARKQRPVDPYRGLWRNGQFATED